MKAWRDGDTALESRDNHAADPWLTFRRQGCVPLRMSCQAVSPSALPPCVPPLCPRTHSTELPCSHALYMCLNGLGCHFRYDRKDKALFVWQRLTRASNHPANKSSNDPSREPRNPPTGLYSTPHPEMLFKYKAKKNPLLELERWLFPENLSFTSSTHFPETHNGL